MRHYWVRLSVVLSVVLACNAKDPVGEESAGPDRSVDEQNGSIDKEARNAFQKKVSGALSRADYKEAINGCSHLSDALAAEPSISVFCGEIVSKALSRWETSLVRRRDTGTGHDLETRRSCAELQQYVVGVSEERSDAVATLCQELALGDDLKQIDAALALALKSDRPRIPPVCGSTLAEFKKLGTAYALTQSRGIDEKCHQQFPKDAVKALMDALASEGDTVDARTLQRCFDIQQLAAQLSEKEQQQAATFCAEIQAMGKASQAIADASRNVKEGTHRVPRTCGMAMMSLTGIRSPTAKALRLRVIDVCYVQLGMAIMTARVPAMEFGCDPAVRVIVDAVKAYRITNSELTGWVQKALPKCGVR